MAISKEQLECMARGGTMVGGTCVVDAKVTLRIYKGNPCQGRFVTWIEKVINPGELRTLAKVGGLKRKIGLKRMKTRK
jgi:hypothetical protein